MHKIEKIIEEDLTDIPLGILISIIQKTRMMYLNSGMKSLNVTASQSRYLIALFKKEGQTQEDLATHFYIDKGAVARGVKKLEDNGFICRKTDPENRRRYLLYITDEGKALMPEIRAVISDWEEVMNKDFTEAEKQQMSDFLKKLTIKGLNKLRDTEENFK